MFKYIKKHKKTTYSVIILLVIITSYFIFFKKSTASININKKVEKGSISVTISGSGQVESSNQLDIKPKVSADIVSVSVKNGDRVQAGDLIMTLDATDAYYNLKSAEIALAKLKEQADSLTLTSAQNSVSNANQNTSSAYDDGYTKAVSAFNDMTSIISNLNDLIYGKSSTYFSDVNVINTGPEAQKFKLIAAVEVDKVQQNFNTLRTLYVNTPRSASNETIKKLISALYDEAIIVLQATKDTSVAIDYMINKIDKSQRTTIMTTDQSNLSSWISKMTSNVNNLLNSLTTIDSNTRTLEEKQLSLDKTVTGADSLDLASAELNVEQKRSAYNNYFIHAPFDGVIGGINLHKGNTVSAGTAVATLVNSDLISKITLNEVDAAKVKVGMPVRVTFDAVPSLIATGTVIDIDSVGTISQNVVSYTATVSIVTADPRIKSGMSTNAVITVDKKDDVLVVPNSAIKKDGKNSYVEIPGSNPTLTSLNTKKVVTVGLTNDTRSEITSGLNEGDNIVIKTTTTSANTTTTTSGGLFSQPRVRTGTSNRN